jgi:hypothetical protein
MDVRMCMRMYGWMYVVVGPWVIALGRYVYLFTMHVCTVCRLRLELMMDAWNQMRVASNQ